jgi:small subunit ribosomal protein S6
MRRTYETTFIVNAALEDSDVENMINKVTSYLENHGAEIKEINKWGRRRLAYPINKKFNGFYIHMIYEANPSTIPILERFLVLEDTVLRNLTLILPTVLREFRLKRAAEGKPNYPTAQDFADNKNKDKGKANTEDKSGN